ncbi:MAG: hypothetical protein PHD60_11095 [Clostridia bacterium]|nr:hypothetical protein [Clostridia bacterium]
MDVGSQMLIGGKSFSEVDWQSVRVSALEGAISGAIATATVGASLAVTAGREGLKLTGKQIAKQAGKTMLVHGTSGMAINATSQAVVKGEVNASEVILSGAVDSVTGGIGRVLPHTGLGKAVKTFGDNIAEKAKGFTRGAFDNTRLVLGNGRGSVGKNAGGGTGDNVVYRALNQKDADRLSQGLGLEAKSPDGTWALDEHLVGGSGQASWANDPFISTTTDIDVAKGFNEAGSNLGIVEIDLNKVPSPTYKGYEIYPRVNGAEGLPYHYSIWQQETSVYQYIPYEAIKEIK